MIGKPRTGNSSLARSRPRGPQDSDKWDSGRAQNNSGIDCVGHAIRAFTDADPQCTVLSIDGVGAYDHVLRSSFPAQVEQRTQFAGVTAFCDPCTLAPPRMCGKMAPGPGTRFIKQGGKQGDPLMPLIFNLGIHDSLCAVDERLRPEDKLCAFLDDMHVVSLHTGHETGTFWKSNCGQEQGFSSTRAKFGCGILKERVHQGVEQLGDEVWSPSGIKIMGTPIGSPEFVRTIIAKRLEDEG